MTSVEEMDEDVLFSLFESCELPRRLWNHRAHVTVAYLYLRQFTLPEAIIKLQTGIQQYNAIAGQGTGYHETVTQTWVHLIYAAMQNHGPNDCARHFFNRHTYLLDKTLPLLFYSDQRIMSKEARESFLEPDLMPLPRSVPIDNRVFDREPIDVPIPRDPYEEIKRMTTIIEKEPNKGQAFRLRGQMYLRRHGLVAALADLQQAIELDQHDAEAYFWLATVQAYNSEDQEAIRNLKHALDLGYRWFGVIYKIEGWKKLRAESEVENLLQQYAKKHQMTL